MNPAALCRRTPGGHQAVLIRYSKINKGAEHTLPGSMLSCVRQKHQKLRAWEWVEGAPGAAAPQEAGPGNMLGGRVAQDRGPKPGSGLSVSWHVDTLGSVVECPGGTPFLGGSFPDAHCRCQVPILHSQGPTQAPLLWGTLHRCPLTPISLACLVYSPTSLSQLGFSSGSLVCSCLKTVRPAQHHLLVQKSIVS